MKRLAVLALAALAAPAQPPAGQTGSVLPRAMRDELERSRSLRVVNLDLPYFIEYVTEDVDTFSASATLGGLVSERRGRVRLPRVQVRVGDYKFDNTNFVLADFIGGSRYDAGELPLDDDYMALRRHFWLATDRAYKAAVEVLAAKRSALKNVTETERLADFASAKPLKLILDTPRQTVDAGLWTARLRGLSAIFAAYPGVLVSSLDFEAVQSDYYLVNVEGTEVRAPEHVVFLRIKASGQAADGMPVRDALVVQAREMRDLPSELDLGRAVSSVAENVSTLAAAPRGEGYTGPVLMEGVAAAQLFAEVLGGNLAAVRVPVPIPGRPAPVQAGELEGRLGSRVLPEWMDVVDDPTQTEWRGRPLFGHYAVDMEGVQPKPLALVEKGVLKALLLTRQPVRGFEGSNGRARMPGSFGARAAVFSNLFVRASETVGADDLKKKLLALCGQRNKPYGMIVRKMDFPSSASLQELRSIASGSERPVSPPLLVYRVWPDGRQELVRGLRFRGLTVRSLKDIIAASSEEHVFDFMANRAPFALMGAGSYVTECSVVAPSVLIDDLELETPREQLPNPPLVPPPPAAARETAGRDMSR